MRTGRIPNFLLIVLPLLSGLAAVWSRQRAVHLGYALAASEANGRVMREVYQTLELQWAAATAPSRLAEMAQTLGLIPAPTQAQRSLVFDKSGGLPQTPNHGEP